LHQAAEVNTATVDIENDGERLSMRIEDESKEFDLNNAFSMRAFGLAKMRRKAGVMGGTFKIDTAIGKRTNVVVELPKAKASSQ
jgi:signal transduction histidine kinase